LPLHIETFEKWLRRASKIFSAKKTAGRNHDIRQAVNVISGRAENIRFAAREPFFSGHAKPSYKQKSHGIFPWLLTIDPESWEGLPCPRLILSQKKNTGGQTL
jgi:hypothetical protein